MQLQISCVKETHMQPVSLSGMSRSRGGVGGGGIVDVSKGPAATLSTPSGACRNDNSSPCPPREQVGTCDENHDANADFLLL